MSILNNRRLAVKVCELYYYAGLSQKEICAKLGISRPQISRILKEARTSGLITITINNPFGNETALSWLSLRSTIWLARWSLIRENLMKKRP